MSAPAQPRTRDPAPESPEAGSSAGVPDLPGGIGWRRRTLAVAALVACLALVAVARWLAATPFVDAQWASNSEGALVLQRSALPELNGFEGRTARAIVDGSGTPRAVDGLLMHRSPRWQVDDRARTRQVEQQQLLAQRLASGVLQLVFDNGAHATVPARPRGLGGLGWLLWPLAGLAVLLALTAAVVVLARPDPRNGLFMLISLCQAGNLLLMAIETMPGMGTPAGLPALDLDLRLALDAASGAAMVHAFSIHPVHLPRARAMATAAWLAAALALALIHLGALSPAWWWGQALCLGLGAAALAVIHLSCVRVPNPYAVVMRRLGAITLGTLILVSAAVAATAHLPQVAHGVAVGASVAWYLFLASLLLLLPFLARSRLVLREFAMLAGISTVAASVDLLFVAVFSTEPFTSMAVAVFVALAVYAGARQHLLDHLLGTSRLTPERMFEELYRAAREVQARPRRAAQALSQLLQELFEPLEVVQVERTPGRAQVVGGGSALVVPVRRDEGSRLPEMALKLRHAQRGQRLFTPDDARLADRLVEQLRRAIAYDLAVERGRHEERQRLAQDLHDDIGARLLTLMYKAPNPEMEDYIRHTLKDLKTLTRGLAVGEHLLSHAAAEWKADLSQRLAASQTELDWNCTFDDDLRLSVVQWSALTRVLRELVTNALFHGHASRIGVAMQLQGPRLTLTVADDGVGRNPQAWDHGLGLGGVRKRIKLLGGTVHWHENPGQGIVCEVRVDGFRAPA